MTLRTEVEGICGRSSLYDNESRTRKESHSCRLARR